MDACHQRGLAVYLDVVYNHLGPEGNYLNEFGPYFTDQYHTPWGGVARLRRPAQRRGAAVLPDNALLYWLREFHIDGLRLDAIDYDQGLFRKTLSGRVGGGGRMRKRTVLGRRFVLIGESDRNDPRR